MAKTIFVVPPINNDKGYATSNQNRQTQYFKDPFFAYPIIPATFVSMLVANKGQDVLWVDAVAEELDEVEFGKLLVKMRPDYIVVESNTMLVNRYYDIVDAIKKNIPDTKVLFCGEHASAFPDEVKEQCNPDYILKGGKWYLEAFKIITGNSWGSKPLPHIDRGTSRWWLYAYKNGNFKFLPGTYIMAGQDCWHRPGCKFCAWESYHKEYMVRSVDEYLEEFERLITIGFKEIFDDSGTFPVGDWLRECCNKMIERGYAKYVSWGCNMRFGSLSKDDIKLMAKAGCRFIIWGFESANQSTLEFLNKGIKVDNISQDLIISKAAGIWNHLTVMFGYPWESLEEEKRTYNMVRHWLINGWVESAQASIFMPYPGTEMYKYCKDENLLLSEDWVEWDMSKPIVKLKYDPEEVMKMQKGIYGVYWHPRFIFNKIRQIRSMDDFRYYFRLSRKIIDRFGNIIEKGKVAID